MKNFLFTSAGNNTNFDELWTRGNMNYDIYVIYYGDDEEIYNKYKSKVKYIEKRKGSKFQNFNYFYKKYPDIIKQYDRFFIIDDDIIFETEDINKMFDISKKYDLSICGPSFKNGRISHPITKHKKDILLSYVNFIEVGVPLFSSTALHNLMKYYDDCLIGWGIDFLYIWANGSEKTKDYAIIHCVTCTNPKKDNKDGTRELCLIPKYELRARTFINYAKKIGCKYTRSHKIYGIVEL